MKKTFGAIGGIVALAAVVAFKMLAPSAEVAATNALGQGWTGAEGELMQEISQAITTEYEAFSFSSDIIQKISKCITDKSIAFLNTTDCSYLYNSATTTEAQHLAEQEKCLAKASFEKKQEGYTMECTRENVPDDWKFMQGVFSSEFEKSFAEQGVPSVQAKQVGTCISEKLVGLLNTRQCKLINRSATKAEDMFLNLDSCIKDTSSDSEFQGIITACTPKDAQAAQ